MLANFLGSTFKQTQTEIQNEMGTKK
jgi:hypothetical protein